MGEIEKNLAEVKQRVASAAARAGRNPDSISLLAVSKKKPTADILQAIAAGQMLFGENYVQEAVEKCQAIADPKVRFDLIGPLQRNKAKLAVANFALIHSVDRIELARELNKQAAAIGKKQEILLQVNVSGEDSKSGAAPESSLELASEITRDLSSLQLKGLMCIGEYIALDQPRELRARDFLALAELREQLERGIAYALPELSMGMSHDFELAIECGATIVRVGSAIFGERH